MLQEKYEPVIGLEVHCQLQTASKAFSPDSAAFGAAPNEHVDPISLGHPGTLPVLNEHLVAYTLRVGLATHCNVSPSSVFARKHYFYPDLPKGYQISQYETPICHGGFVEIAVGEEGERDDRGDAVKRIGLTRIHMEEDAGKSLHEQDPYSTLLDYNRCGVPLIEIVSEPDLRSPREAYLYVQKIRQIVRYLGVCDGNMEEGSLRCDANVSVRLRGETRLGTKTEIKNMNSLRHVERAIGHEISRQMALLESGGTVVQETRLWDPARDETRSMRSKEEAHDYRYFPDPDLPPVVVGPEMLERVRTALPEMPEQRRARLMQDLRLPLYDATLLTEERSVAEYFESALAEIGRLARGGNRPAQAKALANSIMTDVLRILKEHEEGIESFPVEPERLAAAVLMRMDEKISSSGLTALIEFMRAEPDAADKLAASHRLLQVSDESALLPLVDAVIRESPKQTQQYLSGKESVAGYFIGQVMRRYDGSPDPQVVRRLVADRLDAQRS